MANDKERDRERALDLAVSQIEKQFGKGSIMKLGEGALIQDIATISTGSLGLDLALGLGGLPRGRIVEIYGPESSGKTTMALQVVAEAQKESGTCAYIDAEHALDLGYATKLGVKAEELLVSQPDNGEQALEITETLVRSGAVDVIVIDSVAALTPRAEIEGEMGEPQMGLQARLMSQALRKLVGTISRSKTLVIFINQVRMKIGVMFGNPETTTGGNALKFYASVRLDIRRTARSNKGKKSSAIAQESKSSKTKWHRHSKKRSSIFFMAAACPKKESWSISGPSKASSKSPALGIHLAANALVKVVKMRRNISKSIRTRCTRSKSKCGRSLVL